MLKIRWTYNSSREEIKLRIEQTQEGNTFEFPLELKINDSSGSRIENVSVNQKLQSFIFKSVNAPREIIPDPGVKLLFEVK